MGRVESICWESVEKPKNGRRNITVQWDEIHKRSTIDLSDAFL